MTGRFLSGVPLVSLLSLTLVLASCGGGGGGGSSVADGGIRGTGSSVGPVSGFGSVIVNGIRFVTDNLGIDDFIGEVGVPTEDDLEKGMILQIRGEWRDDGEGEAESVRYDDTLRGPVTAIPQSWDELTRQGRIEVMGFEVALDRLTQTSFDSLGTIEEDDNLRISGWLREDGTFRASYVGPVESYNFEEIEGYLRITGDEQNQRYFVGDLEIDITAGAVCEGLELVNGAVVDIEGRYRGESASFVADSENGFCNGPAEFLTASLDEDVQVAGVVTSAFTGDRDNGRFALNGIPVATNEDTDFDDLGFSEIFEGALLQVEGQYIDDNGVLTLRAEEIEYRDADAEVEGRLDGVEDDVLRVGGVEVRLTPSTIREEDDCPLPFGQEHIGQIAVEVAGVQRYADGGYLQALEIDCDDDLNGGEYELEGRIDGTDENPRSITLLGATILVDESTELDDGDFDSLSEGDRVEVVYSGSVNDGFLAKEVERDD